MRAFCWQTGLSRKRRNLGHTRIRGEYHGRHHKGPNPRRMNQREILTGGCHCGNLALSIDLTVPPHSISPRSCDCSFCSKHGASYFSDRFGALRIQVRDRAELMTYRQGSGTAEFLTCRRCGVLAAVTYTEKGTVYGAVNARCISAVTFGESVKSSPQLLAATDKVSRWKDLWFDNVQILSGTD
jgi:hypothetical protein